MVFAWFDTRKSVDFALLITEELYRQLPPNGRMPPEALLKTAKGSKKIQKILSHVFTYGEKGAFNFYQKAKFLQRLGSELRDRGYSEAFCDNLVESLALRL